MAPPSKIWKHLAVDARVSFPQKSAEFRRKLETVRPTRWLPVYRCEENDLQKSNCKSVTLRSAGTAFKNYYTFGIVIFVWIPPSHWGTAASNRISSSVGVWSNTPIPA